MFSASNIPSSGYATGQAFLLPVRLQLLNALEGTRSDQIKRDPVIVVRTNLFLKAPQLGAAGGSEGGMEIKEHRLARVGEV